MKGIKSLLQTYPKTLWHVIQILRDLIVSVEVCDLRCKRVEVGKIGYEYFASNFQKSRQIIEAKMCLLIIQNKKDLTSL